MATADNETSNWRPVSASERPNSSTKSCINRFLRTDTIHLRLPALNALISTFSSLHSLLIYRTASSRFSFLENCLFLSASQCWINCCTNSPLPNIRSSDFSRTSLAKHVFYRCPASLRPYKAPSNRIRPMSLLRSIFNKLTISSSGFPNLFPKPLQHIFLILPVILQFSYNYGMDAPTIVFQFRNRVDNPCSSY